MHLGLCCLLVLVLRRNALCLFAGYKSRHQTLHQYPDFCKDTCWSLKAPVQAPFKAPVKIPVKAPVSAGVDPSSQSSLPRSLNLSCTSWDSSSVDAIQPLPLRLPLLADSAAGPSSSALSLLLRWHRRLRRWGCLSALGCRCGSVRGRERCGQALHRCAAVASWMQLVASCSLIPSLDDDGDGGVGVVNRCHGHGLGREMLREQGSAKTCGVASDDRVLLLQFLRLVQRWLEWSSMSRAPCIHSSPNGRVDRTL